MASKRPQVRVRPGTPADLPELLRIYFDAFDPIVMNRLIYPTGRTASAFEAFAKDFYPEATAAAAASTATATAPATTHKTEENETSPSAVEHIFMVAEEVIPIDNGDKERPERTEIVAFGKWNHVKEPLPEEKWNVDKPATREDVGEGVDLEFFNDFIGGLQRLRRKNMRGDPCLHLEILACTTTRQRLGAGSALLAWGNEFADKHGRTYWLEASPNGYPLYRRFGFEDVEAQDMNVARYGAGAKREDEIWGATSGVETAGPLAEGHFRTMVMKRPLQRA